MESIIIDFAKTIVGYTIGPVGQWLCYSFYYKKNIRSMKNQEKELQLARASVQHSVDDAKNNGDEIKDIVINWLEQVDKNTEEVNKVVEGEKEEAMTKCYNKACLNLKLKLRHQLSRKAKEKMQAIGELLLKMPCSEGVSFCPAPQWKLIVGSVDFVASKSRMLAVKRLMETLEDDKIHLIGVWGMPGVGKSTLVREVAKQAMEKKLFDGVAIANVTQIPNVTKIQEEIADMLHLQFRTNEAEFGRADRLRRRLTKKEDKKMMLVILDDIWKNLDLKEIGIPSEGCKVLLTSRDRDVLVSGMGTKKDFGLEVLDEEEAWSLFEKMAGDCIKDPNLRGISNEVAKACAGLPLALVTVSKALKNKELFEWKDALQLLRRPTSEHLKEMQSTIYSSIELSYKHLESNVVRDVFLHCSQQGYYIYESDLLKYCYGFGLFHGINTMEDARHRLYTILRILKDWCLLLHYSSEILCMHDVVRDAATLIASRDHNMLVVRNVSGLKDWPDVDALKRCRQLSIRGGDIHKLLNEMKCPELRLLYVYAGDRPVQIFDTFFKGMGKLKVLDLTKMQFSSLPSSLSLLENLRTLCLDQCVLGDIAVIGELKNLAVLRLLKSEISQLPREIGLLSCLRLLDLSNCSKLEVIPPNVLSRLKALEELYMGNSFVQWEAEGLNNASLAELKHLSHLTTLEIQISNASSLPKDLLFEKLERYIISIGDEWNWSDRQGEAPRTLKLKLNTSFQLEVGIKMLLKRTSNLYLDELKGVKNIIRELDRDGFHQLKHLHIQNNSEIEYIINSRMLMDIAFPALETFLLKNMMGLEEICHGQLPNLTSFGKLRVVKVEHCNKLKYFFSLSIARGLSQLEELEIAECSIMGAIVIKEEGKIEDEDTTSLFPQLRRLGLKHLPKLMSFLSTQNSLVTDVGEIIVEGKPDFHMPILHEQVVFPNLEKLELSSIGLEDIQGNQRQASRSSSSRLGNMQSKSRFQNLLRLEVKGSNNVKYLLSFSTARYMGQLKYLRILKCEFVEEILVTEDLGVVEETTPNVLFPLLEFLELTELPILKRFCEGSNIKFPSLKHLTIDKCPNLKTFISKPVSLDMTTSCREVNEMNAAESPHTTMEALFNEEVAFPCLTFLGIFHMVNLKVIWRNQFTVDSFCKLQVMQVFSCENLLNVFQSDMLARFKSLEILSIRDCGSLQEVFEVQGINVNETHVVTSRDPKPIFIFQNLQTVRVVKCRSLKSLFPVSVATCLTQLEQLVMVNCKALEEIVDKEEGEQPIARFVFRRLIVLHLAKLPRLKRFYPGVHISEWPKLKNMLVADCPKVEIFASELSSFQEILKESQVEIPIKQPLFLVDDEVPFPSLEKLRIFCMLDLKIIWHNQFTADSFCQHEIIKVEFCENLVHHQETCGVTATQLKELHLLHLPKLKHIWNTDTLDIFSIQNPLEVHAIGGENMESPLPLMSVRFDNIGVVKELRLSYENSGVSPEQRIIEIGSC